jgi:proteasome lid subunit RPN8/RPN11
MLKLWRSQLEEIIAHVQAEAPLEAGGLLAGHGTSVERVYAMKNADQSATTYRLDPEEQYSVFVEIENDGRELIGIYHSHPESEAYPSSRDVDMSYYPEAIYLIVSLTGDGLPELRAFRIRNGAITEEEIIATAGEADSSSHRPAAF